MAEQHQELAGTEENQQHYGSGAGFQFDVPAVPESGVDKYRASDDIVVEESDVLRWFWLKSGNHIMVNQRVYVADANGKRTEITVDDPCSHPSKS